MQAGVHLLSICNRSFWLHCVNTGIWQGPDPTCLGQPAESSQSSVGTSKGRPCKSCCLHATQEDTCGLAPVLHCIGMKALTEKCRMWQTVALM